MRAECLVEGSIILVGERRSLLNESPVRIVAFNVEVDAYQLVAGWATCRGHELALVVTTPGPSHTTYDGHEQIVRAAQRNQDVLVTTKLKRAAPIIAACKPDVIISYTFPYRLPPAILKIPRLGAVNLHPSPLPRYRGPNAHRMLYDGCDTLGATLHRTAEGFDTGAILSRREVPLPIEPTIESVSDDWNELLFATLDEGMARALAGEAGTPQDEADATYAASFTPDERWLDWNLPAHVLQLRSIALNMLQPTARAVVEGIDIGVLSVRPLQFGVPPSQPGTIMAIQNDGYHVAVGDGMVEVKLLPADVPVHGAEAYLPQLAAHVLRDPSARIAAG